MFQHIAYDSRDSAKEIPGARYTGSRGVWEIPDEHFAPPFIAEQPLARDIESQLLKHQKTGVSRALASPGGYLLCWATGLGKTYGAYAVAQARGAKRVLVVCPAIGKTHWAKVATLRDYSARVLWPKANKKREAIEQFDAVNSSVRGSVTVVNYELLSLLDPADRYDMIISDEVHYLSNTAEGRLAKAPRRTRQMFELREANPVAYRLALSATPNQDRPIDLWGTLEWLHPGRWGAYRHEGAIVAMQAGFWRYARYFHEVEKGEYGYIIGAPRNSAILRQRLDAVCHQVNWSDIEIVEPRIIIAREQPLEYSPRTAILTDTRARARQLGKQFPDALVFTGAETPRKRGKMIEQARAEGRGIICTMHAVRESIDLTHWNTVRYAQVPWALLPFVQSMGRFHRLSVSEPPTYHIHVAGPFEAEKANRLCEKAAALRSQMPKGAAVDEWLKTRYSATELDAVLDGIDLSGMEENDGEE